MVVISLDVSVLGLFSIDILENLEEELLDEDGLLQAFNIVIVSEFGAISIKIFVFEPDQDKLAREIDETETSRLWLSEEDAVVNNLLT